MVGLPCRVTHKIRARSVKIREEDNLYAIFASHVNKPVSFMRQWLKCFSISNSSILTRCAKHYLVSIGMTLEVWLEAVKEGRKGDILALYCLSLLLDIHTVIHLHNGGMWTTLQVVPDDHDSVMLCCHMHLAYLGMGIFIELVRRETPLAILPDAVTGRPDIKSIVIGEVTLMKNNTSSSTNTETPQQPIGSSMYGDIKITIPTVKSSQQL